MHITLYRLQLRLELGPRRQALPAYLGSTIRGILAASFREVVCVTQAPVCDGCLLLNTCPYPYIFETPPPLHLTPALRKRFQQAPRPYIFDVPRVYRGQPTLELGLVLVGQAIDYLPYFLHVIQETGTQGLGRAQTPYRLLSVTDGSRPDGPVLFTAEQGLVHDTIQPITLATVSHPGDASTEALTLEFLTPLRIKKYGAYQDNAERLDFSALFDLLWGRLEALALFHCGAAELPATSLHEAASSIAVTAKNMRLQRLQRYSNRHKQKLPLDGLVGTMRLQGHLGPFLPALRMGTYVHIGAGTAFGLGQYRVIEEGGANSITPGG